MRTRCPECGTVFRATSEQLRQKAGRVRCGHCHVVFNAFDSLVPEQETPDLTPPQAPVPLAAAPAPAPTPTPTIEPEFESESAPVLAPESEPLPAEPDEPLAEREETPEETTQAAREAGLVAARDLYETPAFNRWAAGTLAGSGVGGFDETAHRSNGLFTAAAALLAVLLLGQALYAFRTELTLRLPALAGLYEAVGITVPLPRRVELVGIESSDLQSDAARGLFVLQATLQNRAPYRQAWPLLELTLTDVHDSVVSRKVIAPADYLPPGQPADAFPAQADVGLRLWIEARDIGAAGYRLYVFYP